MLDGAVENLAFTRLRAVGGSRGGEESRFAAAVVAGGAGNGRVGETGGGAAGGERGDGLAQALEVGVEVFAVAALDCCVRDALAFAAAVGRGGGVG